MSESETVFEPGEIKMTKVEKFFNNQKEQFLTQFSGLEKHYIEKFNGLASKMSSQSETFIKDINQQVTKIDQKYSGMYNILIKKFLHELESRVYSSELFSKATLNYAMKRFYDMDIKSGAFIGSYDDFIKSVELSHVEIMTALHKENEENAQKNVESKNVESIQEEAPAN